MHGMDNVKKLQISNTMKAFKIAFITEARLMNLLEI